MTFSRVLIDAVDLIQQESDGRKKRIQTVGRGEQGFLKTGASLVAVVDLGGDFLFELGKLVLREGAREDLGTPFDEVVNHVTDRVKHLPFVPLSTETAE